MLDLNISIGTWGAGRRRSAVFLYFAVVLLVAVWMGWRLDHFFEQPDSTYYLYLAEGRPAMTPFASRQLSPLMVRGLVHLTHLSIESAFVVEGIAALAFFVGSMGFLLMRSGAPRWIVPAVGGLFFWSLQFDSLALPDLVYAALMCCFLLLLRRQHFLAAALTMFPLMVSRESTLLTLVCFLAAGWRRLRTGEAVAAVASTVAGILVVKRLAANALPNNEHISPLLYLFAKMPWNLLKNVLAINVWANVYPSCGVPKWQMPLHLGPVHAIGYCGLFPEGPIETLVYGMTTFGLLPVLLIRLRKAGATTGGRAGMLMRFSLIYGGISFAIAPLLGQSLIRLYGYSWPLFVLAVPLLLGAARATFSSSWAAWVFLGLHLSLSWSVLWLNPLQSLYAGVVLYGCSWLLLRLALPVEAGAAAAAASPNDPLKVI